MSDHTDSAIAVIGLGARMPGAADARTFFTNIREGVYSITEVPKDRWDPAIFYHPDPAVPDRSYSRIGGFVSEYTAPLRLWRIPPGVAAHLDSTQILALEVAHQALGDAGLLERELPRSRCAVILGNSMGGDLRDQNMVRLAFTLFSHALEGSAAGHRLGDAERRALLADLREQLLSGYRPISEDTMAGELSNVVAGRVAAAYRLTGPSFTVDAACASALAAVAQAVRSLRAKECDLALTGGVDRNMSVSAYVKFCKTHALSGTGSAPFDASADGFVMGEGAGVLVLKRLGDAERDGDRIRAVIRGVGASSDGGGRGITAPSPDGQLLAIRRALADAEVDPVTLGLVEAHGTSTPVGDAAEVETLCRLFGPRSRGGEPVAVGSVKSNIGHLKSAAGAAGLVKAILALEERVLPPSIRFEEPNPALRRPDLPLRIQTALEPWVRRGEVPRRAGVSAFGFGGTNFHVVLEEHGHLPTARVSLGRGAGLEGSSRTAVAQALTPHTPNAPQADRSQETPMSPQLTAALPSAPPPRPTTPALGLPGVSVFRLGAPDRVGLGAEIKSLRARVRAAEPFEDLAAAYGVSVHESPCRAALVAEHAAELAARLEELDDHLSTGKGGLRLAAGGTFVGEGRAPGLAFLFPGQGSQYVGMLGDLMEALPEVRDTLAEADRVMADLLDRPLSAYLLGQGGATLSGAGASDAGDQEASADAAARALQQTAITQPAMLAVDLALFRVLTAQGLRPDAVAGHSLGEYAAAVSAGVLPFGKALRAVAARGREMSNAVPPGADPGKMAVLNTTPEILAPILARVDGYVVAANKNSPRQTVIAGASRAVDAALASAAREGLQGLEIPVSHAFHSKVVAAASAPLRRVLARSSIRAPHTVIYSNVTAEPYPAEPDAIIELLGRQVASPVEWWAIVERMYASGIRTFVEVGPKKALAGFVRDILGERPHKVIHTNHPKKSGPRGLAEALALLVADGHPVASGDDAAHIDRAERSERVERPTAWSAAPAASTVRAPEAIWVTGVAAGVPGRERLFDDHGLSALLEGEPLLARLDSSTRQAVVDQHIERLVKSADGTGSLAPVQHVDEVMRWAGRAGEVDLEGDYRVSAEWDRDRDPTTRMALGAAHEALRDAWLPLVEERRALSGGRSLSAGFRLPPALGRETGVIFASAFPGYERLLALYRAREAGAAFPRSTLLQILGLGHAHVAERLGALGPNLLVNAACASTPAALALASDWIRAGRCRRVIVVSADNVTSDALLPWIGGGFLALGAASTEPALERAALPFGRTRHGLILGAGAVGFVLESAAAATERGVRPLAELLATRLANSGDHPMRLRPEHIAGEVDGLVAEVTAALGMSREALARELVFLSHETFTPARGGSAQAEVDALRRAFGASAAKVLVVNTKGHTGHPMAVGLEDAAAVAGLWQHRLPPVANLLDPDPAFADLTFHRGGAVHRRYALRLAAGFGSQVALAFYRRAEGDPGRPRVDEPQFRSTLREVCGASDPSPVLDARLLRLRSAERPSDAALPDALLAALSAGEALPRRIETIPSGSDPARGAEAAPVLAAPGSSARKAVSLDALLAQLTAIVAARTGYDPAELEPDLELEADLGIDTVKQAEIVAELRDAHGLPRDDAFRLSEHPTLIALARYLQTRLGAQDTVPVSETRPVVTQAAPKPLTTPEDAPVPMPRSASGVSLDALLAQLTAIVAARTGYDPTELEPDLELEADLGIDTVKQAEIVAELRDAHGLPRDDAFRLSEHPTLIALARYLQTRLGAQSEPRAVFGSPRETPTADDHGADPPRSALHLATDLGQGFSIQRVGYRHSPAPQTLPTTRPGVVLVVGGTAAEACALATGLGHERALHLCMEDLLSTLGSSLDERLAQGLGEDELGGALWRLSADLPEGDAQSLGAAFFRLAQALAARRPTAPAADEDAWPLPWLLTVVTERRRVPDAPAETTGLASHGSAPVGAIAGLTRALGREWPGCRARVLVVSPEDAADPGRLAAWLRDELTAPGDEREIRRRDDDREVLALGGPLAAAPLAFGPDDVVLVTGATGGIGALVARALRARFGCRLLLTGRLTRPGSPGATPPDRAAAKEALLHEGKRSTPAAVTAHLARWHRAQTLDGLLGELEATGEVAYLAADLDDPGQVTALLHLAAERFGRLDGVIHAAGLQRSRGLEGKTAADFAETFACKAGAAQRLLDAAAATFRAPPRRFLGLGSVAGLLGNAGQTDYAAANAALAGLGNALAERGIPGLTIHFTGWDDVGMTSDPDLRERLTAGGLALLPSALGVEAILRLFVTDLRGEVVVSGPLGGLAPDQRPAASPRALGSHATAPPVLRFTLTSDLDWLQEHRLEGIPLLPAVVGLEWMARAAAAHRPGHRVVGMENARFDRPLKVHPGRPVEAVVELELGSHPDRLQARLRSERRDHTGKIVALDHFSAILLLGPADEPCAASPILAPLHLGPLDHQGPEASEIYEHLFHTGRFRVLGAVRLVGPGGLVAEASAAPFTPDVPSMDAGSELTHLAPLAVEAALQAAGIAPLLDGEAAVLPAAIASLTLHANAPDIARQSSWLLRVRRLGADPRGQEPRHHRFDVDLLDDGGAPLLTLRSLSLVERSPLDPGLRITTPPALELVEMDLESLGPVGSRVLELGGELAQAEERRALAITHAGRRLEWIAGRLAAKELVRRHLRDHYGLSLARGRIEIATDPGGAPVATIPSRPGLATLLPALSITHACGRAIALGLPSTEPGVRVGVDLVGTEPRPESFAAQWLTENEQRFLTLASTAPERHRRLAEIWSLKEAVSKALGLGLALTTGELEIASLDPQGRAEVRLHGAAAARFEDLGARRLIAAAQPWPGGVLAWARLELGEARGETTATFVRPLGGLRERRLLVSS